ncbi:MAG: hypothetical protein WBJ42_07355, partial [Thermovirgaceae bacterium]
LHGVGLDLSGGHCLMVTWDERTRVPKETEDEPTHCATGSLERADLCDRFATMLLPNLRQTSDKTGDTPSGPMDGKWAKATQRE